MGSWKNSPFHLPTLLSFHWPSPDGGVRMNVSSTLKSELFLNLSPEFNLSAKVCMYERIRWLPFRSSSTVKLIDWKACVYPSACILKWRVWWGTKSFYFFISLSIEHSNEHSKWVLPPHHHRKMDRAILADAQWIIVSLPFSFSILYEIHSD